MNIAFDYDDTLDLAYELFSVVTHSLIAAGHKVFIITHIPEDYRIFRENQLKQYNIAYTELVITGDKYYECQKRGIEYIFDDCSQYFLELAPIYLQAFAIPSPYIRVLPDGYTVELAILTEKKLSGITTMINYRIKGPRNKEFGEWHYVEGKLNDLKSQMFNVKTYKELIKLWRRKTLQLDF